MASTLTLVQATAYALKYHLVSDGVTDVVKTQANLIADAATFTRSPSNIKKLLTGNIDVDPSVPWTDAQWAALAQRKDFSVYTTLNTATAGALLSAPTPGNRALTVSGCAAGEADIELRFLHSILQ